MVNIMSNRPTLVLMFWNFISTDCHEKQLKQRACIFENNLFTVEERWKEKNIVSNSIHLRVSNRYTRNNFAVEYHFKNQFSVCVCVCHLWDVVLCSLWGRERHGCHGHHDWLVRGVDSRSGSLWARPYGGCVRRDGGPRSLHLSPLEKLEATCERNSIKYDPRGNSLISACYSAFPFIKQVQFFRCLHYLTHTFLTARDSPCFYQQFIIKPSTLIIDAAH